jgi:hypothetical protein
MKQRSPERWKVVLQCEGILMPRKAVVIIGIMLCLNLFSCNLFKTRTPDEPDQISTNDVPATDPSLVFQNMIYAFQEGNAFNYSKTISDNSFTFMASGKALQRYGELNNWNKTKEHDYFNNVVSIIPKYSKITLEFTTIASTNFSDSCELVKTYLLNVPNTVGGSQAKVYKGQAQFTLRRDPLNSNWFICRWSDYELNSSDSTWSDLKGSFAN